MGCQYCKQCCCEEEDLIESLNAQLAESERLRAAAVDRVDVVEGQLAEAREAVREAYEAYAGSDGFLPETAPEAYQARLINQMADILGKALAGEGGE